MRLAHHPPPPPLPMKETETLPQDRTPAPFEVMSMTTVDASTMALRVWGASRHRFRVHIPDDGRRTIHHVMEGKHGP